MTAMDTYHDVEPYTIEGRDWHSDRASARCLTHSTTTTEEWVTHGQAARGFACDEGRGLRFVTEFHGDDITVEPVMRDLTGLARTIRSDAESHAYGQDYGTTHAWQWHPGGRVEPLAITLASATEYDEDYWGSQTWQVTGEDGRVILEVSVRIDGRA